MDKASAYGAGDCRFESCPAGVMRGCGFYVRIDRAVKASGETTAARQRGRIEPLRGPCPLELKSNPSTSPTHPGSLAYQQSFIQKLLKY